VGVFGVFIGHVATDSRVNFCLFHAKRKPACFLFGVYAMADLEWPVIVCN
jgi:hypothetical protein